MFHSSVLGRRLSAKHLRAHASGTLLQSSLTPKLQPDSLAGIYADPAGGVVHVAVNTRHFSLTHSMHGPVPGIGRIESHRLHLHGHSATFGDQCIYWDNGVVASKVTLPPSAGSSLDQQQLVIGVLNMKAILDIDEETAATLLRDVKTWKQISDHCLEDNPDLEIDRQKEDLATVLAWAVHAYPRTLFVNGLGKFDTKLAYRNHCSSDYWSDFICTPSVIQAWGYLERHFPSAYKRWADEPEPIRDPYPLELHPLIDLFGLAKDDYRFRYFVQHYQWFTRDDNVYRLDEVLHLPDDVANLPDGTNICTGPRRLLEAVRSCNRAKVYVNFDWLDSCPKKESDIGNLVPLCDSDAIVRAGDELSNCAANYIDRVKKKQCVLIALQTPPAYSTIALAEFDGQNFRQLEGANHSRPAPSVELAFQAFLPELRYWWHKAKLSQR